MLTPNLSATHLPSRLLPILLSGIERPVLKDDDDIRFSLNALTPSPHPFLDCPIEMDNRELEYLRRDHAESLRRAAFDGLSAEQISAQIRAKLTMNYIYNLARATDIGAETLKFNSVIESGEKARHLCALEYRPQDKRLRVITFY